MGISFSRKMSLLKRGLSNYFLKRPFAISFEITHCCNARCKHCHLGGRVEEKRASPQRYGELCRELKPFIAQVSGGEPMLRRDLEQIVEALKIPNGAPYIALNTNGYLLTKERYIRLHQAGVDTFSISLDFPDKRHDEFRGIPGLFNHIETFVKSLPSGKNNSITLNCVIHSDNFKDLIEMAELARKWNAKLNFSAYTFLRTDDKSYILSTEELEEFKKIIRRLLDFRQKYGVIMTSDYVFKRMTEFFRNGYLPNCCTGIKFFNVNPDGTFSPCGLIIKNYKSKKELIENFFKNNNCKYCYTSNRANCEKPAKYLFLDGLKSV